MKINSKVVVIGNGHFGNATAQGLQGGFVEGEDGVCTACDVVQVPAREFFNQSVADMAAELRDAAFVCFCGTNLPTYANNLALAIQQAARQSMGPALEFIDFSNPDPALEKGDVSGAIDLWRALEAQGSLNEVTPSKKGGSAIKVWKVTELGSVDVAGIVGNTFGLVYGSHPGGVPNLLIPGLSLKSAGPKADLFEEALRGFMSAPPLIVGELSDGCTSIPFNQSLTSVLLLVASLTLAGTMETYWGW